MAKKYAISSRGKTLKSFLDVRFGRCENIVLFDTEKSESSISDNQFKNAEHAGTQLVDFLVSQNVTAIITGEVGPKVMNKLQKEKIQLVLLEEDRIKIEEVISRIS